MSTADYDEAEKLFCGTWKNVGNENLDAFMTAAEMPDSLKKMISEQKVMTITRVGDSFHYKIDVGGVAGDFTTELNETAEWKEKDGNPILHVKTIPTFKDGVWTQDCTPLEPDHGKRYLVALTHQGDEVIYNLSIPDVPGITAKRHWEKC